VKDCKGDVNSKYCEEKMFLKEGDFLLSKPQWLSQCYSPSKTQDMLEEKQHVIVVDSS